MLSVVIVLDSHKDVEEDLFEVEVEGYKVQMDKIFEIDLENVFVNVLEIEFVDAVFVVVFVVVADEMFDNFELFDSFDFLVGLMIFYH